MHRAVVLCCLAFVAACPQPAPLPPTPFSLICDSADTRVSSTLFCMLIDTRNGAVTRVDINELPRITGEDIDATGTLGAFELVCDSTNTETKSDFRCLRLDRRTGTLALITFPDEAAAP